MELYLIYADIDCKVYDKEIKYILPNEPVFQKDGQVMKGLYAWTTKKKLLKEFKDDRKDANIYLYLKKEVDEDELENFLDKYDMLQLKRYGYNKGTDENGKDRFINITSTKNEFIITTEFGAENMQEDIDEIFDHLLELRAVNDDVCKACCVLGIMRYWKAIYGEIDEIDYLNYQESFGLNPTAAAISHKDLTVEFNTLTYLFQYMFTGYGRKE